jgi:glucose-1-phosphate thymidylyltransferase
MVQKGSVIGTFEVDNWFDCGKKEILLQTNTLLLKRLGEEQNTNHILEHSIIIPPVYIGENAVIRHSVIGPNVSIGNDTHIESSIICNSIIGPHAHIGQAVLKDSLIGNDASLKGMVHTLNLGDSAEINFS